MRKGIKTNGRKFTTHSETISYETINWFLVTKKKYLVF